MEADELLKRYAAGERDFCRLDLSEADFSGADLSGINLSGANLSGVKNFTAKCPGCGFSFPLMTTKIIHCYCSRCGWFRQWYT